MKKIFFAIAAFYVTTFIPPLGGQRGAFAQNVGINATGAAPAASAGIDVNFPNKGILIPRITLTQTTSASPVTSPVTSLLVYNTASVNDVTPGYYFWNGTIWIRLLNYGNSGGTEWLLSGNSLTGSLPSSPNEWLGTINGADFIFKTNNSDRMRISSSGLVGINMSPLMQLDVTSSSANIGDAAIRGAATGSAAVYGVQGTITSTTNTAAGVFGLASGTSGQVFGVLGQTYSTTGNSSGVRGYAGGASGATFAMWGENASNSNNATGVYGSASAGTGSVNGVWGNVSSTSAWTTGVYATASGGSGTYGLYASNSGNNGNGIYGECSVGAGAYGIWGKSTTGEAGHFSGNVAVTGNMSKGGGSFKIDHPLDPENKFLYHSFVESPDMLNIYNGNITTNDSGTASVKLPSYFETENMDFKYQLTAIGQFAQAIVLQEISGNQFVIKTDKPKVKVSWQVTGIRNDKWAQKHRIIPEVEKNLEEKGRYLHPDLFGYGEDKSIDNLRVGPGRKEDSWMKEQK